MHAVVPAWERRAWRVLDRPAKLSACWAGFTRTCSLSSASDGFAITTQSDRPAPGAGIAWSLLAPLEFAARTSDRLRFDRSGQARTCPRRLSHWRTARSASLGTQGPRDRWLLVVGRSSGPEKGCRRPLAVLPSIVQFAFAARDGYRL